MASFSRKLTVGDDHDDEEEAITCTITPCNGWEGRLHLALDEDAVMEIQPGAQCVAVPIATLQPTATHPRITQPDVETSIALHAARNGAHTLLHVLHVSFPMPRSNRSLLHHHRGPCRPQPQ